MIEAGAALLAWLGASLIVLGDGRRALALGLGLVAAGFGLLAWASGQPVGAVAVVAGGLTGSSRCWRAGTTWDLMPPGSTPRLVLCVASALIALWVAASVTTGPGGALRFAAVVVLGLMVARVMASRVNSVVLTSIACIALALAAAPSLGATSPGPAPGIIGALIAAAVTFLPGGRAPDEVSKGRAGGG